jgi:hypothetical protein
MASDQSLGLLRGRFKIALQSPLPHLNSGENQAYKVEDQRESNGHLYGIVLASGMAYRDDIVEDLSSKYPRGLLQLRSHGIVNFSDTDSRYIFVFEQPMGGSVFNEGQGAVSEHELLNAIVPRLIDTLIDLDARNISHRSIRATNIYYMDSGKSGVSIGECVTTPPATLQPAVYEPLESANALAYGRGNADIMADIYALGITIVHMLGGILPGEGRTPKELYAAKLLSGTYAVLVPKIPTSTRVGFLLAGLLNDDPNRRWTLDVLKRWRDGVYERPRPGFGDRQAPGPLVFEETEYVSPRLLALAMTNKPAQAFSLLENGKLESWVRNSLNEPEAAKVIAEIGGKGNRGGGRKGDAQSIAKINAVLDNDGAFWYREISFSRGGVNTLLAHAFSAGGTVKNALAELLENGVLLDAVYQDLKGDGKSKKNKPWMGVGFATDCFEFMEKRDRLGFGLERCLYELNPRLSCMSPVLEEAHVKDVEHLTNLLEIRAQKTDGKLNPFDRHVAAFVAAHVKSLTKMFGKLNNLAPDSVDYTLHLMSMVGRLQVVASPSPKPGLCRWVGTQLKPLIKGIHSDFRREFLLNKLEKTIESGNIDRVLKELDLKNNLNRDNKEYDQAVKVFASIRDNINSLEGGAEARKIASQKYGQWIASLISIAALMTSMGLSYMYFLG